MVFLKIFMPIFRLFHLALRGLKTNKLRSYLTTVGIVIGIATVVVVMSLGESAKLAISSQLLTFGGNTIFVEITVPNTSHAQAGANFVSGIQITSMKESDMEAAMELPNVTNAYAAIMSREKISYENRSERSQILGTNASYPDVDKVKVAAGRFFNLAEEKGMAKVAVLGSELKKELFPNGDALNKTVRIKGINFRVIGVMEERGNSFFMNLDDMAIMPLKSAQKQLLGIDYITYFTVAVADRDLSNETAENIRFLLRKRHGIPLNSPEKDDFHVTTMDEALELTNTIVGGVSLLLTSIAIISLIVGGIGIMNIMYVSVSERTREIGLRKAIGARGKDILYQFLLEAVAVTGVGGIFGVMLGLFIIFGASLGADILKIDWDFIVSPNAVFLALGASSTVGFLFGIYPARKAARLDPIVALRRE